MKNPLLFPSASPREEPRAGDASRPEADYPDHVFRKLLLEKKAEVLMALALSFRRLAALEEAAAKDPFQVLHEEILALRANRIFYGKLRHVEAALERLDCGGYGTCANCGNPISAERLYSIPWARHCASCNVSSVSNAPPEAG